MLLAAHGAIKPLGPLTDPFWSNVVFMQTFDGFADGTVLSDPIPSLKTGTSYNSQNGANLTITSAYGRFGKSAQQQGSVTRLITTLSSNFTFEVSVYYTSGSIVFLYIQSGLNDIARFQVNASNVLEIFAVEGGGYVSYGTIAQNNWYDCAVSWDGTALRCFVNGALVLTTTKTNSAMSWRLPYNGTVYVDDVRLTSACRYTSNYSPSHPFPAA